MKNHCQHLNFLTDTGFLTVGDYGTEQESSPGLEPIRAQKNKGFQSLENPYSFIAERQGTDSRLRARSFTTAPTSNPSSWLHTYFPFRTIKKPHQLSFLFLYCIKLCRAAKKVNHLCKVKTPFFTIQYSSFIIHYKNPFFLMNSEY